MNKDLELAKSLDFDTIEDLHDYIVISLINGQSQQSKELFNKLENKLDCIFYIKDNYPSFLIDLNIALFRK